jgi:hypothetical protein
MKLRVYLDTTVISAAEDPRAPDRRAETLAFFDRAAEFDLASSELTRSEILATPDPERRQALVSRFAAMSILAIEPAMRTLAQQYVAHDIIPQAYQDDALHIAIAVLSGQDVLASWNFRHLVNRRRRAQVNLLNACHGLPTIEIVTPSEL